MLPQTRGPRISFVLNVSSCDYCFPFFLKIPFLNDINSIQLRGSYTEGGPLPSPAHPQAPPQRSCAYLFANVANVHKRLLYKHVMCIAV